MLSRLKQRKFEKLGHAASEQLLFYPNCELLFVRVHERAVHVASAQCMSEESD